jgi:hypothetical protein
MSREFGRCRESFESNIEGAIYHLMNRGDRRELISLGDADRELFHGTLGEACGKTGRSLAQR